MQTIILPGFSSKNKSWAEEIKDVLALTNPTTVVNWTHWETGETAPDWMNQEINKIIDLIQDKPVNLLAKSIGTLIAMMVLEKKPALINKIILCGIPVLDFHSGDEKQYKILKTFPSDKIICFQNESDNHGSYYEVEKFLHSINPAIKIISKPRSDHEYPYAEEFSDLL